MYTLEDIDVPDELMARSDIGAQILCSQIDSDHQNFIRRSVISQLDKPGKLNWRDIRVMGHINWLSDPATPARLSELTRFNSATILRVNQKLKAAGMIHLEEHQHDARSNVVVIEPAGRNFMTAFFTAYERESREIIPAHMPELTEVDIQTLTKALLVLHERAERLAGLNLSGRHKGYNTTPFAQEAAKLKYGMETYLPGLVFQLLCRRISRDYLVFFKRHAVSKLTADPKIKLRELRILMCIEYLNRPSAPHEIVSVMRYDPATVTRAITILCRDGYTDHVVSDRDEREKPVWLTDNGRLIADEYKAASSGSLWEADIITGQALSKEQMRNCLAALMILRKRSRVFSTYRKGVHPRSKRL
ncbi:MarR family winged helix-turn-helix transcriptional regulator [Robiginitomaculum antarcticum]|uniref:MarR family winged helix-turn-helix transcriptional regulator n=1 Tax=Robiginitomaculum antarcticum TaxID=437507 RepID=UPI0003828D13|nr:MarR family transcriptional regulator [Robiginitomaculum antarcticum]